MRESAKGDARPLLQEPCSAARLMSIGWPRRTVPVLLERLDLLRFGQKERLTSVTEKEGVRLIRDEEVDLLERELGTLARLRDYARHERAAACDDLRNLALRGFT